MIDDLYGLMDVLYRKFSGEVEENYDNLSHDCRCRQQVLKENKIPAQVTKTIFALLKYPGSYKVKITLMINAYKRKGDEAPLTPDVALALLGGGKLYSWGRSPLNLLQGRLGGSDTSLV